MAKNSKQSATDHDSVAVATIKAMADKWPSTMVSRTEVKRFSGGCIAPGTLANLDSQRVGIPGAFKIGRQVCYPVNALVEWLISKIEVK